MTVRKNGEVIPTNILFLTSNSPDLEGEIKVEYLHVKVKLFVPNQIKCYNCNRFSHTSAECKTTAIVSEVQKRNMMDSVMDPKMSPIAVVLLKQRLLPLADGEREKTRPR